MGLKNTKKKVLFVATVDSHIELFHLPYLKMFKDKGYEVHVATNTDKKIKYCDKKHKISIERNPFKLNNLKAIHQLKKIVNAEHFDVIHCHTPMGGVVARLAAKKARKTGTRMIYTAHGFHFFTGAPLKNWLLFYPVEKYLAKYTDTLITINHEDFERAKKKFGKRCKDIQYVPGVGVDEKKFSKKLTAKQKHDLRKSLGLKDDDFVMIYTAELSKRKNQTWLIKTLRPIFNEDRKKHLLLLGWDSMNGECQKLARKLGLEKQVHFLGFRSNVDEFLMISDLAISSSKQEGLPVNLIEAAMVGLPIVATECRGNVEVVKRSKGYLVPCGDAKGYVGAILEMSLSYRKRQQIESPFSISSIKNEYELIYSFDTTKNAIGKEPGHTMFSIIIPACNAEKHIGECLDSVVGQNFRNYEIIIIDDGSKDNTRKICEKYAKDNDNIKVITQKNSGVSIARSNGVSIAKGEYLLFCDSDDMLDRNTLSAINNVIKTTHAEIVCFNFTYNMHNLGVRRNGVFYSKKQIEKTIFPYLLEDKYGHYFSNNICFSAFKKDIYTNNEVKNEIDLGEDLACKKATLYNSNSIYLMDDVLYFYRRHKGSATMSKNQFMIDGPKRIGKHLESKIDIDMYDMKQQLDRVVTHQLFLVLLSQFANDKDYHYNKKYIIKALSDPYYKGAIDRCKYSFRHPKGLLAKMLLKHRMTRVMYLIYKIKYARLR